MIVTKFVPVASYLDDNVGGQVELLISRGSELKTIKITIADKHLMYDPGLLTLLI
jgi:hypothetical protein